MAMLEQVNATQTAQCCYPLQLFEAGLSGSVEHALISKTSAQTSPQQKCKIHTQAPRWAVLIRGGSSAWEILISHWIPLHGPPNESEIENICLLVVSFLGIGFQPYFP